LLILGEDEARGTVLPYSEIREMAVHADDRGLDSIWTYDHLLYQFGEQEPQGVWECWTLTSALTEATKRVEIGTLVLCTAFRNPAVTAKMAVALDEVSDGRLILGIGAGWHQPEFDAFGLQFSRRVGQFEEAVKIIAPLLRDGSVDFEGEFHSARNCQMLPRPKRRIPLLIAGRRPRMLQIVARYSDLYNIAWFGQVHATEPLHEAFDQACRSDGKDPSGIEFTVGINVAFPELGDLPEDAANPDKWIAGSVEEVGRELRRYRERGVPHLITVLEPFTPSAVELLAAAKIANEG
jgi:alkanesulfonate monooxygenase SsuD/methylene tetrahydromethanopterin reductase-like flavin-dependent oxidoreductase (luciferase family)